jgi:hypothetical protein
LVLLLLPRCQVQLDLLEPRPRRLPVDVAKQKHVHPDCCRKLGVRHVLHTVALLLEVHVAVSEGFAGPQRAIHHSLDGGQEAVGHDDVRLFLEALHQLLLDGVAAVVRHAGGRQELELKVLRDFHEEAANVLHEAKDAFFRLVIVVVAATRAAEIHHRGRRFRGLAANLDVPSLQLHVAHEGEKGLAQPGDAEGGWQVRRRERRGRRRRIRTAASTSGWCGDGGGGVASFSSRGRCHCCWRFLCGCCPLLLYSKNEASKTYQYS